VSGAGTFRKTGVAGLTLSTTIANLKFASNAGGLIDIAGCALQNDYLQSSFGGNLADINLGAGTILDTRGEGVQMRGLTGAGNLISTWLGAAAGTNTYTVGVGATASDSFVFGGIIVAAVGNSSILPNQVAYGGGVLTSTTPSQAVNLVKSGAGTQSLTGTNIYTDSTTINSGTLQVGNGGTTGSFLGMSAVVNNGTLAINRTDTTASPFVLSNNVSGTGRLLQSGTGTTKVMGNNTFSGGITVSKGAVILGNGNAVGTTYNYNLAAGTGAITMGDANTGSSDIALYLDKGINASQVGLASDINVTNNGTGLVTIAG
jgi:autotransporter-associated beta strand protein